MQGQLRCLRMRGTSFSSKYSIKDVFSGAWFADQDFDKAIGQVMQKMKPEDDFVVITEFQKISEIREKYNLVDSKVLTPGRGTRQAVGLCHC
jgi:hypothetical protein